MAGQILSLAAARMPSQGLLMLARRMMMTNPWTMSLRRQHLHHYHRRELVEFTMRVCNKRLQGRRIQRQLFFLKNSRRASRVPPRLATHATEADTSRILLTVTIARIKTHKSLMSRVYHIERGQDRWLIQSSSYVGV